MGLSELRKILRLLKQQVAGSDKSFYKQAQQHILSQYRVTGRPESQGTRIEGSLLAYLESRSSWRQLQEKYFGYSRMSSQERLERTARHVGLELPKTTNQQ